MLVTVGVIVILANILVIALSSAARSSAREDRAADELDQTAIAQFKTDQGYLPPVRSRHPGTDRPRPRPMARPSSSGGTLWVTTTGNPGLLLPDQPARVPPGYGAVADGYGFVATNSQPIPPLLANNDPGSRLPAGLREPLVGPFPGLTGTNSPEPAVRGGVVDQPQRRLPRPPRRPGIASFTGGNLTTMPGRVWSLPRRERPDGPERVRPPSPTRAATASSRSGAGPAPRGRRLRAGIPRFPRLLGQPDPFYARPRATCAAPACSTTATPRGRGRAPADPAVGGTARRLSRRQRPPPPPGPCSPRSTSPPGRTAATTTSAASTWRAATSTASWGSVHEPGPTPPARRAPLLELVIVIEIILVRWASSSSRIGVIAQSGERQVRS